LLPIGDLTHEQPECSYFGRSSWSRWSPFPPELSLAQASSRRTPGRVPRHSRSKETSRRTPESGASTICRKGNCTERRSPSGAMWPSSVVVAIEWRLSERRGHRNQRTQYCNHSFV